MNLLIYMSIYIDLYIYKTYIPYISTGAILYVVYESK